MKNSSSILRNVIKKKYLHKKLVGSWLVFAVIFCLLLPMGFCQAQIYVDPCAPGPGDGTETNPFNKIADAIVLAKTTSGSDKIILKGGSYSETMTVKQDVTLTSNFETAVIGGYRVGWRDITLTFESGLSTNARVYYPSEKNGSYTQFAIPCEGKAFPVIAYVHAKRDYYNLCDWVEDSLRTDNTKDYLQAEGILKRLAAIGFVAISFDWHGLTIHYDRIAKYAIEAISYLGNEFGSLVDLQRVGVIGHSTGGAAAIKAAEMIRNNPNRTAQSVAVGLIAPSYPFMQPTVNLNDPVLVIHGENEHPCQVGLQPLEIYCEAAAPKHLVVLQGANHYGYTDGICLNSNPLGDGKCIGKPFDPYELNPRDYLLASPGWDNDSEVGGLTGRDAHALQQRTATHYLKAFFSYYLQNKVEVLDYLLQKEGSQCGHVNEPGLCAQDLLIDPAIVSEPIRYFDDLQSLDVKVKVFSCAR